MLHLEKQGDWIDSTQQVEEVVTVEEDGMVEQNKVTGCKQVQEPVTVEDYHIVEVAETKKDNK